MKTIEMTKLLEMMTTEITKDFTDRDGNLSDKEIKVLRAVGAHLEKMAEIAASVKDLNNMKEIINE